MNDVLIIGGGPAGLSCAMTLRQRGLSCAVVSSDSDAGWLAKAERLDNYPGLPQVSGKELLRIFREQAKQLGAEFIHGMARQIQPMGDFFMTLVGNDILESKAVVLALGASRPKLLPGEEELLGRGVSWCGTCDGMFFRGKKVAVLSAWDDGAEEALFLANLASSVSYYTLRAHHAPEDPRITHLSGKVEALRKEDGQVLVVTDEGEAAYDGVFVFRPSVAPDRLLPGLELDGAFIRTDRRMAASVARVYACGDCAGKPLQVAKAVGEGNIAAIAISEDLAHA